MASGKERVGTDIVQILDVRTQLKLNGSNVTPNAADLNLTAGMAALGGLKKVAKVALAAVDTAGGCFSFQNPETGAIVVNRVTVDVTTKATSAGTLSVGSTAVSGTTSSANLIDTLDVGTAAGTFDNVTDAGSAGKARQKVAAGKWVTGSKASGALAGLVGSAYIEYFLV
jgi:hypothetical protein